jgi:hypothetical protein
MSKFVFTEPGAGKLEIEVSDPFTICEAPPGEYRIHPKPFILNDGRLIMTVNRDPDIYDAEYCVLASGDRGITWMPENRWPGGDGSGRHLATAHALLPDGTSLVVYPHMFATETPGSSIMPTWRSGDSGKTWSAMEAATVETPYSESIDIYDPPEWYREAHTEEWRKRFIKPEPPRLCAPLFSSFGRKKLLSYLTNFHSLDDGTLLAFIYLITVPFQPYITICIESRDAGRTWTTRSTPGPFRPEYEETNRRKKPVDGLCEPAATHLPGGKLITVMRMGGWQPLYAAWSDDGARTWTSPRKIPIFGILPTILTLPGGILALASGRPDNTLSFSLDGGESWPWTLRLRDQTNPYHPSTRNNGMVQIDPGRLLYLADTGYRRPDKGVDVDHRVEGFFVNVATS